MSSSDGFRRLQREGARERDELAKDVTAVAEQARAARPWVFGAMAAASAAVLAVALSRVARSRRSPYAKAVRRTRKTIEKSRRRPIPVTLLFALLRTPAARRALVAGAAHLLRGAGGTAVDTDDERREASADPGVRPAAAAADEKPGSVRSEGSPGITDENGNAHRNEGANRRALSPEAGEEKAKEGLEDIRRASPKGKLHFVIALFRESYANFTSDEALTRGAALAYYTLLSLAPLLVVVIAVAGLAFGADNVRAQILGQIGQLVGADAAKTIAGLMAKSSRPSQSIPAAVLGVATLLLGAGGVFGYLHDMMNRIWKVPEKKTNGLWTAIRSRFLSFAMVLGTGFLLLVSLVVSTGLSALGKTLGDHVGIVLTAIHQIFSWAVIGLLFALIFRFLPDAKIAWRDVWIGAGLTSLLFVLGQFLIGLYLGRGAVASVYGGAGSLVIVLLWTYYSGLILFFGAEMTRVFAHGWGSRRESSRSPARPESRKASETRRPGVRRAGSPSP